MPGKTTAARTPRAAQKVTECAMGLQERRAIKRTAAVPAGGSLKRIRRREAACGLEASNKRPRSTERPIVGRRRRRRH